MIKAVSTPASFKNSDSHFKQFPRRLFIFHSFPTLNGTIISFIWDHKTLRIKKKQINPPKGEEEDRPCQLLDCRLDWPGDTVFFFNSLASGGKWVVLTESPEMKCRTMQTC